MQPEPVFADDDADAEEQQQARQAHPGGRPGGDDAGQQHQPTGQQHQIQLLQAHFIRQLTSTTAVAAQDFAAWVTMSSCSESEGGPPMRRGAR